MEFDPKKLLKKLAKLCCISNKKLVVEMYKMVLTKRYVGGRIRGTSKLKG